MYSSSTELMLTLGDNSVHGFTLNQPKIHLQTSTSTTSSTQSRNRQFLLTRPFVKVPTRGYYYSLNEGRSSDWPVGLRLIVKLSFLYKFFSNNNLLDYVLI